MTTEIQETADIIQKEAGEKYQSSKLANELESYKSEIFQEIVEYFKEQGEEYPHLEAFEIYLLTVDSLSSGNPDKAAIRKTLNDLFDADIQI